MMRRWHGASHRCAGAQMKDGGIEEEGKEDKNASR